MSSNDRHLSGVTPPVLHDLADHIEAFAEQLHRVANDTEMRLEERRQMSNQRRIVKEASIEFLRLVDDGMNTKDALAVVTGKHCVDAKAITLTIDIYRAKVKNIQKIELNRRVMLLYQKGLTYQDIGLEVGRTRKTVQRIVKEFRTV